MKSFYSLIKIAPNEMSGDTLTIGILLSTSSGIKVKFSKLKKQLSKSLISADSSIVDFVEKEILVKVKEHNNFLSDNKNGLFEWPTILDADYFSYLSKYSNGLLKFSSPTIIADNIDDVKFQKLFRLFVDSTFINEEDKKPAKKIEKIFFEKVEKRLISIVKDKVHIHQQIDSKIVPSLFNPFEMDCIGLNGVLVGAKALPFTQSKETLHKSVNTYISVIAQLSAKYKKSLEENKFYLIADQPDKKTPEYKLWKQLFSNEKLLKVISSDESGQVAELIEDNKASKFL
jgi:hypothetical protein